MNRKGLCGLLAMLALVVLFGCRSGRQVASSGSGDRHMGDTVVIMSYNVENFFDPADDPAKQDESFTPGGDFHWTEGRMRAKARRLAGVFLKANAAHTPDVIGLCEVEGPSALKQLVLHGRLDNDTVGYYPLCFTSPDTRGICTAMLFNKYTMELLETRPIFVSKPNDLLTRDVLYAKLRHIATKTEFHIMVNHWPSKYGGEKETIWKRDHVAKRTRAFCDSILGVEPNAKIVLMGDFNDTADVEAISETFGAKTNDNTCTYRNLSADTEDYSYKYRGHWQTIDHIIVTPGVCEKGRPVFSVVRLPELLEPDDRYVGDKPFRTYLGRKFNYGSTGAGGYSDHLPVMIKVVLD